MPSLGGHVRPAAPSTGRGLGGGSPSRAAAPDIGVGEIASRMVLHTPCEMPAWVTLREEGRYSRLVTTTIPTEGGISLAGVHWYQRFISNWPGSDHQTVYTVSTPSGSMQSSTIYRSHILIRNRTGRRSHWIGSPERALMSSHTAHHEAHLAPTGHIRLM